MKNNYKGCLYNTETNMFDLEVVGTMLNVRSTLVIMHGEISPESQICTEKKWKYDLLKCLGLLKAYFRYEIRNYCKYYDLDDVVFNKECRIAKRISNRIVERRMARKKKRYTDEVT